MIDRMTELGPPLSDADVEALEQQIGLRLPAVYKAFLLKYNGGRPSPSAFRIQGLANNPTGNIKVFLLSIAGAVVFTTILWAGPSHTFEGNNWVAVLDSSLVAGGLLLMAGGIGLLLKSYLSQPAIKRSLSRARPLR